MMKETVLELSKTPYHLENCELTTIEKKGRLVTLTFLDGIYKDDEKIGGAVVISNVMKDSYMIVHKKKHKIEDKHHLDLLIDAYAYGKEYLFLQGEKHHETILICLHFMGNVQFETVS
jgi:hypothetical protein